MLKINQKIINQCYSEWAREYDKNAELNPLIIKDYPIILRLLNVKKNDIGLDLGCGTGLLTLKIAKKVKKIIGVDFSEKMLNIAKSKIKPNSNIEFLQMNISKKIDFPNSYFDFVVCSLTLSHIKNLKRLYQEVHRILKKNGIFVYDDQTSELKEPFAPKYKDYLAKYSSKEHRLWIKHSLQEHLYLIDKTGFKIEKIIVTKIDKELKNTLIPDSYKKNEGCFLTTVFKIGK